MLTFEHKRSRDRPLTINVMKVIRQEAVQTVFRISIAQTKLLWLKKQQINCNTSINLRLAFYSIVALQNRNNSTITRKSVTSKI